MAAKTKMLKDLFHETLKDMYFAEKQWPLGRLGRLISKTADAIVIFLPP
jgi:ferritin-like metal-binding protein YciE